jgi:ADP-ribose pyrophosphatase YjhB (NUDIX family)
MNNNKNAPRFRSTSCGTVTWRIKDEKIEILLIKQFESKEEWGLPKGRVKEEETFAECALRETFEETGVVVQLTRQLHSIAFGAKRYVFFVAEPVGTDYSINQTHPDNETAKAAWVDVNSCPELTYHSQIGIARALPVIQENEEALDIWIRTAMLKIYDYSGDVILWDTIRTELGKMVGYTLLRKHFGKKDSYKGYVCTEFETKMISFWETLVNRSVVLSKPLKS